MEHAQQVGAAAAGGVAHTHAPQGVQHLLWVFEVARVAGVHERRNQLNLGDLSQFSVIVIDESHNFRNPGANRWRNLFELVRNANPDETRLILLTATPVNNSVYDLYHQIRLITRDDKSFFQIAGIDNLEGYFRKADETRETLYELLEAISVRRSRAFIRRHYPNTEDELVKRLNLQAHRLQELPKVQRQIVQRLNILPPSATRNELLTYFNRPLPEVDLRALRDVWKQAQRKAPPQMLQRLKAFAEAHPHPPVNAPQQQAITADDLECVAWMWLV
ncbi:MAG: SNF2-related protein [Fimbriimonadales bacterium]